MKEKLYILIILLISIACQSCNKNQQLINTIEGQWYVSEIVPLTFEMAQLDNIPQTGQIWFNNCKIKEQATCSGNAELGGEGMVEINYFVLDDEFEEINISISDPKYPYQFVGQFLIDDLDEDKLVISGALYIDGIDLNILESRVSIIFKR